MRAAGPAAGAAHTTMHFGERFFDTNAARFLLFSRGDPADPLIAR